MIRPALALLLAWPAVASAAPPAPCAEAPNQAERTLCAVRWLQEAEAGLTRAHDALQARLDPLGRHNLDRAQRAWRTFRDRECDLKTGYDADHLDRNGTIMPMLVGTCAAAMTERRARDLTEQLACPGGDLSCER